MVDHNEDNAGECECRICKIGRVIRERILEAEGPLSKIVEDVFKMAEDHADEEMAKAVAPCEACGLPAGVAELARDLNEDFGKCFPGTKIPTKAILYSMACGLLAIKAESVGAGDAVEMRVGADGVKSKQMKPALTFMFEDRRMVENGAQLAQQARQLISQAIDESKKEAEAAKLREKLKPGEN